MTPSPTTALLTPERLRAVLGIGETTELEWRRRRKIAFFKQGRVVRYAPEAVLEFIARNTVKARSQGPGVRGQGEWPPALIQLIAQEVKQQLNES